MTVAINGGILKSVTKAVENYIEQNNEEEHFQNSHYRLRSSTSYSNSAKTVKPSTYIRSLFADSFLVEREKSSNVIVTI